MSQTSKKLMIGLTGSLGSGCTAVSEALAKDGFRRVSVSKLIKDKFRELHPGKEPTHDSFGPDWRAELQDIGNDGRNGKFITNGSPVEDNNAYWIDMALKEVDAQRDDVVIDGIRNRAELEYLRAKYPQFWLVAVCADRAMRWSRLQKDEYDLDYKTFLRDDRRDSDEGDARGQTVQRCVDDADYVFRNADPIQPPSKIGETLASKLAEQIGGMRGESGFRDPWPAEAFMATAVSQSHVSRCKKRKVGALIVDEENNIALSVGYNDNPVGMESCYSLYNGLCYKDKVMATRLESMVPLFCPECGEKHEKIEPPYKCDRVQKNGQRCRCNFRQRFFPSRNIELCTAIHAEERAILSLAGRSAEGCTIYVNTFPCFQCARQIKNAGIKKVVYIEAYPIEEAVDFLKENEVEIESFEGFKPRVFNRVFKQVE